MISETKRRRGQSTRAREPDQARVSHNRCGERPSALPGCIGAESHRKVLCLRYPTSRHGRQHARAPHHRRRIFPYNSTVKEHTSRPKPLSRSIRAPGHRRNGHIPNGPLSNGSPNQRGHIKHTHHYHQMNLTPCLTTPWITHRLSPAFRRTMST